MSRKDLASAEQLMIDGARSFDLELSPRQLAAFAGYRHLLSVWGARLNLTAIREDALVVRLHFLDSLSVVPLLSRADALMDIGSGAGFPGIPIKLVSPEKPVYLVEPRRKRANFLRHVIRELDLTDAHVIESRAEDMPTADIPPMMETVTRGFSDIPEFVKASGKLLGPNGTGVLMQGPKGPAKLDELRGWFSLYGFTEGPTVRFSLPFGSEQRTVLTFKKV
ncbi:MAG: 16S rRNA (guanine(527)-N(7))-methyltransferase RsmG [Deltaproteobacteria bacterium]|nr:16S rRNA (guanine(527)-N(7))-methyltransferase RsmG [Deltaproteobacteria bacterium]